METLCSEMVKLETGLEHSLDIKAPSGARA
jgi:hypothetical protein